MDCKFKQMCKNKNSGCENCCHNPEADLEDAFEWNGEGKEPDLDDWIEDMLE